MSITDVAKNHPPLLLFLCIYTLPGPFGYRKIAASCSGLVRSIENEVKFLLQSRFKTMLHLFLIIKAQFRNHLPLSQLPSQSCTSHHVDPIYLRRKCCFALLLQSFSFKPLCWRLSLLRDRRGNEIRYSLMVFATEAFHWDQKLDSLFLASFPPSKLSPRLYPLAYILLGWLSTPERKASRLPSVRPGLNRHQALLLMSLLLL